jgi:hypothetical protein
MAKSKDSRDWTEQTADEQIDRTRLSPAKETRDGEHEATSRSSKEGREKPSVEHIDINGLHRSNSLNGRQARQSSHDEGRKCEEDSGDDR